MQVAVQKTSKPRTKTKPDYFVGIDLHKKFMQVAIMDEDGEIVEEKKIDCDHKTVTREFTRLPENCRYVIESSSVWYGMYRLLSDKLKLDIVLSNPYKTRIIAESKKKTDKVDARILADLLRGGYISECYIPAEDVVQKRQLVKFRACMAKEATRFKNLIHGILLQEGIAIKEQSFSTKYRKELRKLKNWRIDAHLGSLAYMESNIADANYKIRQQLIQDKNAQLLNTIPGIGEYTALTLSSMIDDIERFRDAQHLTSYFGLVPSVRRSASTVHHGKITKMGQSLVRQLLTECAIIHVAVAIRKESDTPISVFYKRVAENRGGAKAKVAAAAKMVTIIYWILKKNIDYETCVAEGRKNTARQPRKKSLGNNG